jgi:hypothetical protein
MEPSYKALAPHRKDLPLMRRGWYDGIEFAKKQAWSATTACGIGSAPFNFRGPRWGWFVNI